MGHNTLNPKPRFREGKTWKIQHVARIALVSYELYQAAGVISTNVAAEDEEPQAEVCVAGRGRTQVSEKVEHCIKGITHKGLLHPVRVHIPHLLVD